MSIVNILYDITPIQAHGSTKINGGGQFSYNLFKYINSYFDKIAVTCIAKNDLMLPDEVVDYIKDNKICTLEYNTISDLAHIINSHADSTVVLPVCYPKYSSMNIKNGMRVIAVVHDLSTIYADRLNNNERYIGMSIKDSLYERCKNTFGKKAILNRHIDQHKKLFNISENQYTFTVSNYSKYAMMYYFGNDIKHKPIVIYPMNMNDDLDYDGYRRLRKDVKIKDNEFFLLLSGSRWNKNNLFAVKTLDELMSKNLIDVKYKVVVTGVDKTHKYMYICNIRNKDRFIFLDYISSEILECLYKNMFSLIYPSLYEGFGFPIVYALKYYKNIIATTSTSLMEVCDNSAYFFDPMIKESLAVAILRTIDNPIDIKVRKKRYQEILELQERGLHKIAKIICCEDRE